ncbi:flagellar biosynthesis protein FlhA [Thioclava sp. ES.031]|uniref:flagellar biosynthesis protein FlhA n=1 Tax=Thioclava sp. ES.031 TaxID=1798203 RepID=UPI000BF791CC|nr:flagellar biosynthesis protein FlhA [Thioclava sp. ES.031]PFG61904.1 flagellar biosynthesis protein FlhA [Thioclava sp. ES.031]
MSQKQTSLGQNLVGLGIKNRDIGFAIGVTLILGMLFVPLPPIILDFGLAISLSVSVLILMVALWIPKPLEFNSFPTLLLVVTMLRLSLNISSTRLILSQGHTGPGAAGGVIEGFSRFIVGGDFVIGIVIFAILVVINFVVITKGSTRIAEVSARFSLDAMPGKQMAIDADLGAGLIDEVEAKRRRKELEDESGFFGAMDGASKFVRGDAVAGIIITLINVVGGILIGVVQHGLSVSQAAGNYTVLTIGDGLVTQIPALVVSLAAGLIVTKGGTEGAANEAVLGQLSNFPKALYMAAVLLAGIGLLPGFPIVVFFALAGLLAGLGWLMQEQAALRASDEAAAEARAAQMEETSGETTQQQLKLDELRLSLGAGLVPLISSMDAALPGKVKSLRNLFMKDYGFVLPSVRIKDDPMLPTNSYSILVQGVEAAKGELRPNLVMVIDPSGDQVKLPGERIKEPTFGLSAVWIDPARASEAEQQGHTVVDPESVITTHLTEIIKEHMSELLTYGAVKKLLAELDRDYQKLASDISNSAPEILLQQVLQSLLAERISIRNLPLIIEAVAEAAPSNTNPAVITERVRARLANQICRALADGSGFVPVLTMSGAWEHEFGEAVKTNGKERTFLMSPQRVQEFVLEARQEIQRHAARDEWPALMVAPEVRGYVRSMLERVSPMTQVISHNEVHRKAAMKTVGTIGA